MGKKHAHRTMGWAVVTVHLLGKKSVELVFEETEKKKECQKFIGRKFFYPELILPRSTIQPGVNHPFNLEKGDGSTVLLEHCKKYVVLANFWLDPPKIFGGETVEVFDMVRSQVSEGTKPRYRVTFMVGDENKGTSGTLPQVIHNIKVYLGNPDKAMEFLRSSKVCWYQEIGGTFEHSPQLHKGEVSTLLK